MSRIRYFATNSYFDVGQKVFHQIIGTAIGIKFELPFVRMFMDSFETQKKYFYIKISNI